MTQNERVLAYIREHGEISPKDVLDWSPPITRLAARIADLKAAGHRVDQVGSDGKFAKYGFVEQRAPRCPKCDAELHEVRPTVSPQYVTARCLTHGPVTVKR